MKATLYTYRDVTGSLSALVRIFGADGVTVALAASRLQHGASLDVALTTPKQRGRLASRLFFWRGRQRTLQQIVVMDGGAGVASGLVRQRLAVGWSLRKAVRTPKGTVGRPRKLQRQKSDRANGLIRFWDYTEDAQANEDSNYEHRTG